MMRTFYICLLTGLLAACNEAPKKAVPDATVVKPAEQAPEPPHEAAIAGKYPDAFCGMPYDTAYHEWSVYKKDTLYFCSPTCKRGFDRNPEKFAAKLGL
jgi:YHS domain-containing protein